MAVDGSTRTALIAHVAFVEATLDSLDEGIVACDATGTLVLFNEATRRLHGLPVEELPPERWAEHYDLLDEHGSRPLEVHEIPLFRALAGEEVGDVGMVIAPKMGGPPRRIRATGRQVRADDGTLLGAVVAMRDITEQLATEEEAARRRGEAEQLRTELMIGLSHDMRSPLSSIVGFTELLDERIDGMLDSGRLPEVLDALRRQAAHLDSLLGQLLDSGLIAPSDGARSTSIVRLDELVARVVDGFGYTGRVSVDASGPVTVRGDEERIHRAIGNLVANAVRHTDGEVDVRVRGTDDGAVVTVRDRGSGLGDDPEELFQRAVRGGAAGAGHGLGLHLARRVVEELGGSLTGADHIDGGAVLTLTLPLADTLPARPPTDAPPRTTVPPPGPRHRRVATPPPPPPPGGSRATSGAAVGPARPAPPYPPPGTAPRA